MWSAMSSPGCMAALRLWCGCIYPLREPRLKNMPAITNDTCKMLTAIITNVEVLKSVKQIAADLKERCRLMRQKFVREQGDMTDVEEVGRLFTLSQNKELLNEVARAVSVLEDESSWEVVTPAWISSPQSHREGTGTRGIYHRVEDTSSWEHIEDHIKTAFVNTNITKTIANGYQNRRNQLHCTHSEIVADTGVPSVASETFYAELAKMYNFNAYMVPVHTTLHASSAFDALWRDYNVGNNHVCVATLTYKDIILTAVIRADKSVSTFYSLESLRSHRTSWSDEMQEVEDAVVLGKLPASQSQKAATDAKAYYATVNIGEKGAHRDMRPTVLSTSIYELIYLLSTTAEESRTVHLKVHEHACAWFATWREGKVIITPRDPNYSSLQVYEDLIRSKFYLRVTADGWCQTWQAFDTECVLAGVPQKHADMMRDVETYIKTNKVTGEFQTLLAAFASESTPVVSPADGLTSLVRCLFARNIDLLVRCDSAEMPESFHEVMAAAASNFRRPGWAATQQKDKLQQQKDARRRHDVGRDFVDRVLRIEKSVWQKGFFSAGDKVTIVGIKSAPARNGLVGIVESANPKSPDRLNVRLVGTGDLISFHKKNLKHYTSGGGAAAIVDRGDGMH